MRSSSACSRRSSSRSTASCAKSSYWGSASAAPRPSAETCERRAATPERLFETVEVELAGLDTQGIPGRLPLEPIVSDDLAQPRHVVVERMSCARRRPLTPQSVDEAIASHALALIHISEPTRLRRISYAVFCLKK